MSPERKTRSGPSDVQCFAVLLPCARTLERESLSSFERGKGNSVTNEKIENVSLGEPVAHHFASFDLARRGHRSFFECRSNRVGLNLGNCRRLVERKEF